MDVTGTFHMKQETQKVSDKFSKREFVLKTEGSTPYPQFVSFQVTQDKCSLLDSYNTGDEVKVHFNLRGREWNGPQGVKYFNTLEAWRIEGVKQSYESSEQNKPLPNIQAENHTFVGSNDNDNLPF